MSVPPGVDSAVLPLFRTLPTATTDPSATRHPPCEAALAALGRPASPRARQSESALEAGTLRTRVPAGLSGPRAWRRWLAGCKHPRPVKDTTAHASIRRPDGDVAQCQVSTQSTQHSNGIRATVQRSRELQHELHMKTRRLTQTGASQCHRIFTLTCAAVRPAAMHRPIVSTHRVQHRS